MTYVMGDYDRALEQILREGEPKSNSRTGVKTLALCGVQTRFSLLQAFPIVTRRKVWPRSIFAELVWFLSGSTNVQALRAMRSSIWDPWEDRAFEEKHGYVPGSLGPVYGFQLRSFGGDYGTDGEQRNGFDQLRYLLQRLKEDKTDRRILFSLWNPCDIARSKLPPCHLYYQVFVDDHDDLTGFVNQRSCDYPVGIPANIQFYAALTMMIARHAGLRAKELVHSAVDAHIYEDQIPAVQEYLARPVRPSPILDLSRAPVDLLEYKPDDFQLVGYEPGAKLTIPVAV